VPTFDDVADEFESILIEDGNGPGPYGAKELGEGGIIPWRRPWRTRWRGRRERG